MLTPITARNLSRYSAIRRAEPASATVATGPFACEDEPRPDYLPKDWHSFVHPEGQAYFYYAAEPRVVTDTWISCSSKLDVISKAIQEFQQQMSQKSARLESSMELMLELGTDGTSVYYYIIDHATCRQFWLDPLSTDELGLAGVVSPSHLNTTLEELYWTHVEYFPSHFGGIAIRHVDNLLSVLRHAELDHLTSSSSTFPYPADKCAQFSRIVGQARAAIVSSTPEQTDDIGLNEVRMTDPYSITCVARLWGIIVNSRFITHSGQESARLNRNQGILASYDYSSHDPDANYVLSLFIERATSLATWTASSTYRSKLDDIFVDEIVYTNQWHLFIDAAMQDWHEAITWGTAPLLSGALTFAFSETGSINSILAASASAASLVGILSGSLLRLHHTRPDFQGAGASMSAVVYYLDALFFKPTEGWEIPILSRNGRHFLRLPALGFTPLSTVFAAPKAGVMWALAMLLVQFTLFMAKSIGPIALIGLTLVLAFAVRTWKWLVLASTRNSRYYEESYEEQNEEQMVKNKGETASPEVVDTCSGLERPSISLLHRVLSSMGSSRAGHDSNDHTEAGQCSISANV